MDTFTDQKKKKLHFSQGEFTRIKKRLSLDIQKKRSRHNSSTKCLAQKATGGPCLFALLNSKQNPLFHFPKKEP